MNLNFSEMDDPLDVSKTNYWDVKSTTNSKPKKKVTFGYDDILSSINLVVNPQGVLQYMTPTDQEVYPVQQPRQQVQQPRQQVQQVQQIKKVGVDPQVKNSAIYNKYFKNYQDPNEEPPQVKIPQTREELIQMLIEEHVKRVQAQKRLAQIKPKKMLFAAGGGMDAPPIHFSPQQRQNSLNKLFRFR